MPTKSKSNTLTQTAILAAAAVRRHGYILPLPEDADPTSAKVAKLLKVMLAAGLMEERPTSSAKNAWRSDEHGKHILLRITEAGRQIVSSASEASVAPVAETLPAPSPQADTLATRAPGGKLGQVLAAVQAGSGASLGDLVAMTGWQPHTVRASLTRLRQSGVPIELTQSNGHKRYYAGASSAAAQ